MNEKLERKLYACPGNAAVPRPFTWKSAAEILLRSMVISPSFLLAKAPLVKVISSAPPSFLGFD